MIISGLLRKSALTSILSALLVPGWLGAYQVSTANKHAPKDDPHKFGKYRTVPVNKLVKRANDDTEKQALLTENPDYFKESNVIFFCPGNSLLTGIISKYKYFNDEPNSAHYSSDRNFSFICTFFEDEQDRLLRKLNCDSPKDMTYDNEEQKDGASQCTKPTQFVGGFDSRKYREDPDAGGALAFFRDRRYKTQCCELQDQDGTALKAAENCNTSEFSAGSNFTFECPEGSILKNIQSTYKDGKWDRSYTLTCCPAAT